MIGDSATLGRKEIDARAERLFQIVQRLYLHARRFAEFGDIGGIEGIELVGTESGRNVNAVVYRMRREIFGRVVRRRHKLHFEFVEQFAYRYVLQFFIGLVENLVGGILVERLIDAEHLLQFEMSPIIERIADQFGNDLGVFFKLFFPGGSARYVIFVHATHTHGAPLIVIAAQPQRADVADGRIRCDEVLIEMTMIIDDREILYLFI